MTLISWLHWNFIRCVYIDKNHSFRMYFNLDLEVMVISVLWNEVSRLLTLTNFLKQHEHDDININNTIKFETIVWCIELRKKMLHTFIRRCRLHSYRFVKKKRAENTYYEFKECKYNSIPCYIYLCLLTLLRNIHINMSPSAIGKNIRTYVRTILERAITEKPINNRLYPPRNH